ncbi:MAG: septum formation inhibitor Maf [Magnetococcales bacterium]|nr:septum formation inhibitor Maf [Magnetococcales bacterium]
MKTAPLILASTSPYRHQLLERLAIPFTVESPNIDESQLPNETPKELVQRLAREKAFVIAKQNPGAVVIGSDQIAVIDGKITGKPGTHAVAVEQLRSASGKEIVFYTGLCCYKVLENSPAYTLPTVKASLNDHVQIAVVPFKVVFRNLSDEQIHRYLKRDRPYNCAGSFKSEGLGVVLFDRLIGDDPSALMGLPLIKLTTMLDMAGVSVL